MRRFLIFITGLIAGGGIGAGVSLLFAPSSSQEMRQNLKTRWQTIREHSKQAADQREAQLRAELAELTQRKLNE